MHTNSSRQVTLHTQVKDQQSKTAAVDLLD
jgi:hypothetical protein